MSHHARTPMAAAALAAALALAPQTAAAQGEISWDVDHAIANGSGCTSVGPKVDTVFIAAGADAAVVFSGLGVELPAGGASPALAGQKNCIVHLPATILAGHRITGLSQMITYGVEKSAGSSGSISASSMFFGLQVAHFDVDVPPGERHEPSVSEQRTAPFDLSTPCKKKTSGLYKSTLAVAGHRANAGESLILAAQGLDLRYDVLVTLQPCEAP